MMIKQNENARKELLKGIEILNSCVACTLGPRGRNVLLDRQNNSPLITNDGVTIAKQVKLDNPIQDMGFRLVKQASIKTNDIAGDGTTTAVVLTSAIACEGFKNIAAGANAIKLRKGILNATDIVCNKLKELSSPISSSNDIEQIATISAGDKEIGKLISEAYDIVGKNGVIIAEDGKSLKTELTVKKGMKFDRGYASPYLVTSDKQTCELENCALLVTDRKIGNINELLQILEQCLKNNKQLLIIADDYDNDTLSTLILNKLRGTLNVVAIKAPEFGEQREKTLQDICALTSAHLVSYKLSEELKDVQLSELGFAKKVSITSTTTTIIGCDDNINLKKYIENLELALSDCEDSIARDKLRLRLSRLTSGVAQILVGAASEVEQAEKKLRIEDALSATKAAISEGVVCGGGIALIQTIDELKKHISALTGDEKTGANIVLKSLSAPLRQIAFNCGVDGGVVIENVLNNLDKSNFGYNGETNEYCDMKKCGIIDPTKVTRCALQNAASIAAMLLTTDCIIVEDMAK